MQTVQHLNLAHFLQIQAFVHSLADTYPKLVEVEEIGRGHEGNPLLVVKVLGVTVSNACDGMPDHPSFIDHFSLC